MPKITLKRPECPEYLYSKIEAQAKKGLMDSSSSSLSLWTNSSNSGVPLFPASEGGEAHLSHSPNTVSVSSPQSRQENELPINKKEDLIKELTIQFDSPSSLSKKKHYANLIKGLFKK